MIAKSKSAHNNQSEVRVDSNLLFVGDNPWLHNRTKGELSSAKPLDEGGLVGVLTEQNVIFIVPQGKGVTKSFFEGYFSNFARNALSEDYTLNLSERISVTFTSVEGENNDRLQQTASNMRYALNSIETSWRDEMVKAAAMSSSKIAKNKHK